MLLASIASDKTELKLVLSFKANVDVRSFN
jgi:hypothetical protein